MRKHSRIPLQFDPRFHFLNMHRYLAQRVRAPVKCIDLIRVQRENAVWEIGDAVVYDRPTSELAGARPANRGGPVALSRPPGRTAPSVLPCILKDNLTDHALMDGTGDWRMVWSIGMEFKETERLGYMITDDPTVYMERIGALKEQASDYVMNVGDHRYGFSAWGELDKETNTIVYTVLSLCNRIVRSAGIGKPPVVHTNAYGFEDQETQEKVIEFIQSALRAYGEATLRRGGRANKRAIDAVISEELQSKIDTGTYIKRE